MPAARTGRRIWVGEAAALAEGAYLRVEVLYAGEPDSVLVFRFRGTCYAYRNLCVHMPRRLDCEKDMIFDATGQRLRCSMHGIVYDPRSGQSLSTMCNGQRLTAVRVQEDAAGVWLYDKRVRPL
jgi:nitrite reductase/ring-hydroxylating ferredoxin subunit